MPPVRAMLACGLAAPLLAAATDLVAKARWPEYRPIAQSISELTAVGASTRPLVASLNVARDALLAAFAVGVREAAAGNRALAATGALVAANATIDAFATVALPRSYADPTWAARNTANTVVMATAVGCFMAAMGTGAVGVPGRFRAFSAAIPISFGLLTLASLPRFRPDAPASTGAQERTMAYSYLAWDAVLALVLLRRAATSSPARPSSGGRRA